MPASFFLFEINQIHDKASCPLVNDGVMVLSLKLRRIFGILAFLAKFCSCLPTEFVWIPENYGVHDSN